MKDSNLKIELVVEGLKSPTSMAFLGKDDILVLEKAGLVQRIIKNHIIYPPILNISNQVSSVGERGLLGIAVALKDEEVHVKGANFSNSRNIFYTILKLLKLAKLTTQVIRMIANMRKTAFINIILLVMK